MGASISRVRIFKYVIVHSKNTTENNFNHINIHFCTLYFFEGGACHILDFQFISNLYVHHEIHSLYSMVLILYVFVN